MNAALLLLAFRVAFGASPAPAELSRQTALGEFVFHHPDGLERLAADLEQAVRQTVRDMSSELGEAARRRVEVYMAADRSVLETAAPVPVRMPAWAAGMALPREGIILLFVGGGRPIDDMQKTFLHEYAHVGLHRAAAGARLPRWFQEGYAMYRAGEWNFQRAAALGRGVLSGKLFSLEALTERFPGAGDDVELAYAQSIDFVGFLLARHGAAAFAALLANLSRGQGFLPALEEAYDLSLRSLEDEWRADLQSRFTWISVLAGTSVVWIAVSLVFVLAYLRRRRVRRRALEAMEDDPAWVEPPPEEPPGPTSLLH